MTCHDSSGWAVSHTTRSDGQFYLDNLSQPKVDAHQSCEEDIFAKGKEMTELVTLRSGFLECDAKVSCRKGTKTSNKFLRFLGLLIKYIDLGPDSLIQSQQFQR